MNVQLHLERLKTKKKRFLYMTIYNDEDGVPNDWKDTKYFPPITRNIKCEAWTKVHAGRMPNVRRVTPFMDD